MNAMHAMVAAITRLRPGAGTSEGGPRFDEWASAGASLTSSRAELRTSFRNDLQEPGEVRARDLLQQATIG
jgi:hypothetical protein